MIEVPSSSLPNGFYIFEQQGVLYQREHHSFLNLGSVKVSGKPSSERELVGRFVECVRCLLRGTNVDPRGTQDYVRLDNKTLLRIAMDTAFIVLSVV